MTMTWSDARTRWLAEMLAGDASKDTIRLRLYYLRRWERLCPKTPTSATRDALIAFQGRPGWAPNTRRSVRASLVAFYTWMHDEGFMPHNPAARLPSVRVPIAQPRPATDQAIRSALKDATPAVWLMIMLGAVAGMRRAEIARSHRRDLDDQRLRIHGKGGKIRTVDLPAFLAAKIAGMPDGYLFPNPKARNTDRDMTPGHVGRLIGRALPAGVTPHQLRHAAASELHEQGCSMEEIRIFLGHASIATTQSYVLVNQTRTAQASERAAQRFAVAV